MGGGNSNVASYTHATVGGGYTNTASGYNSTIGGGRSNTASSYDSTVGGGSTNTASGACSTVGGGCNNTASSTNSTISGGCSNITNARHSTIGGGHRNIIQSPTNECCSRGVTISGGIGHNSSGGTLNATTGDLTGAITCCNAGVFSTIGGGLRNCATGACSTVGGGGGNTASGSGSVVSGGCGNTATGDCSSIGGGCGNTINSNAIGGVIGGGRINSISTNSTDGFIGGGCANVICGGKCSFIGGGFANQTKCSFSVVVGGCVSCACASNTFIGGGCNNKIITGNVQCSSIVGGLTNCITSACPMSFIGGGCNNCIFNDSGCGAILGGKINRLCHGDSFIIGSNLTSTATCYTFVNNLCNVGGGVSDCRLKENITALPYGLCEIKQLEPIGYTFKNDESKSIKYGFLAQCIQQIMPDLITTHPTDLIEGEPVLQFDKEAIWSSLVNAIKQQQIQIDELKAEIELLKNS